MKLTSALISIGLAVTTLGTATGASAAIYSFDFQDSNAQAGQYFYASGATQYSSDGHTVASVPGGNVGFAGFSGVQNASSAWGFLTSPNPTTTAFLQSYEGNVPGSVTFTNLLLLN